MGQMQKPCKGRFFCAICLKLNLENQALTKQENSFDGHTKIDRHSLKIKL